MWLRTGPVRWDHLDLRILDQGLFEYTMPEVVWIGENANGYCVNSSSSFESEIVTTMEQMKVALVSENTEGEETSHS